MAPMSLIMSKLQTMLSEQVRAIGLAKNLCPDTHSQHRTGTNVTYNDTSLHYLIGFIYLRWIDKLDSKFLK